MSAVRISCADRSRLSPAPQRLASVMTGKPGEPGRAAAALASDSSRLLSTGGGAFAGQPAAKPGHGRGDRPYRHRPDYGSGPRRRAVVCHVQNVRRPRGPQVNSGLEDASAAARTAKPPEKTSATRAAALVAASGIQRSFSTRDLLDAQQRARPARALPGISANASKASSRTCKSSSLRQSEARTNQPRPIRRAWQLSAARPTDGRIAWPFKATVLSRANGSSRRHPLRQPRNPDGCPNPASAAGVELGRHARGD